MATCWIFSLFLFSYVSAQFPAEGIYITLRNDSLNSIFQDIGLQVADVVGSFTSAPTIQGSTSKIDYTLSSFVFDIDLEQPSFSQGGFDTMQISFNIFKFVIQVFPCYLISITPLF